MLSQHLARAVRRHPDKVAVVQGPRRISYADLAEQVARCAAGFAESGVGQGACVALALANAPEFIVALLAAARLRAIVLPLNPLFRREEMMRLLRDAPPRVLVADAGSLDVCRQANAALDSGTRLVAVASVGQEPDFATLGRGLPLAAADDRPWDGPALW